MTPEETARKAAAILDELEKAVVGRAAHSNWC